MLYEFIQQQRVWLLERARSLREARAQVAHDPKMEQGFELFLDQFVESLKVEQAEGAYSSSAISGPLSGAPAQSKIGTTASVQGGQMYDLGISIDDMVHSYGDLCHVIVELVSQQSVRLEVDEFRLLNHCLDSAIANAVAEYSFRHEAATAAASEQDEYRRLTALGDQFRKHLGTATTAIAALKARELRLGGVTGSILERSLMSMNAMVNEFPSEQTTTAPSPQLLAMFPLASLLQQIETALAPCFTKLSRRLTLAPTDPTLALTDSRDSLQSAIICLLQSCIGQTLPDDEIALHGYTRGNQIVIDIVCPPRQQRTEQDSATLVAQQLLINNNAELLVRDNENDPFTFSICLPRHSMTT